MEVFQSDDQLFYFIHQRFYIYLGQKYRMDLFSALKESLFCDQLAGKNVEWLLLPPTKGKRQATYCAGTFSGNKYFVA